MNQSCDHDERGSRLTCVSKVPIFNHLSEQEMKEVEKLIRHQSYKRGESIFLAEDQLKQLIVIHKGKVKISRLSETGAEQLIRVLEPGEFMGETALFGNSPLTTNAESIADTEICLIKGQEFKEFLIKYPETALKVLEVYSKRVEQTERLIEQIGLHDSEQRVAAYLLQLVEEKQTSRIHLDFSKKDFASLIGTSQETLSRKLARLQNLGFIKLEGQRHINIINREGLEQVVLGAKK